MYIRCRPCSCSLGVVCVRAHSRRALCASALVVAVRLCLRPPRVMFIRPRVSCVVLCVVGVGARSRLACCASVRAVAVLHAALFVSTPLSQATTCRTVAAICRALVGEGRSSPQSTARGLVEWVVARPCVSAFTAAWVARASGSGRASAYWPELASVLRVMWRCRGRGRSVLVHRRAWSRWRIASRRSGRLLRSFRTVDSRCGVRGSSITCGRPASVIDSFVLSSPRIVLRVGSSSTSRHQTDNWRTRCSTEPCQPTHPLAYRVCKSTIPKPEYARHCRNGAQAGVGLTVTTHGQQILMRAGVTRPS